MDDSSDSSEEYGPTAADRATAGVGFQYSFSGAGGNKYGGAGGNKYGGTGGGTTYSFGGAGGSKYGGTGGGYKGFFFRKPAPIVPIDEMWAAEEALSLEERRSRYNKYKTIISVDDIVPWSVYLDELEVRQAKEAQEKAEKEAKKKAEEEAKKLAAEEKAKKKAEEAKKRAEEGLPAESSSDDDDSEEETKGKYTYKYKYTGGWWNKKKKDEKPPDEPVSVDFDGDEELNNIVALWRGDITCVEVDAIVNAANSSLLGGGGIDGAIHRAAGDELYNECRQLNGCKTGSTKISRGYNLPAKYVLHTVGPIREKPKKLKGCYRSCLDLAVENGIRTLVFCGVSTGIFGYPLYNASRVALRTVRQWLEKDDNRKHFDKIVFCTFLPKELLCYEYLMPGCFPRPGTPFTPLPEEESEEESSSSEEGWGFRKWKWSDSDSDDSEEEAPLSMAERMGALEAKFAGLPAGNRRQESSEDEDDDADGDDNNDSDSV